MVYGGALILVSIGISFKNNIFLIFRAYKVFRRFFSEGPNAEVPRRLAFHAKQTWRQCKFGRSQGNSNLLKY